MEAATASEMQKQHPRNRSLCQQTIALFWKNVILKWRMRTQSFQEWLSSLLILLVMLIAPHIFYFESAHEIPEASLGQLDDLSFNFSQFSIVYTPGTKMAREIMEKVSDISVVKGIRTELMEDEKAMEAALANDVDLVGVVFQNDFSYRLRFPIYKITSPDDTFGRTDTCFNYSSTYCKSPTYWYEGFLSLQSSIDSALIELITNHSVWDEMKSISGIRMRSVVASHVLEYYSLVLVISIWFSPFTYFLSQNVSKEKRKLKELMKTMGLRDMAFWLSWSLVYVWYILIVSCMMTLLTRYIMFAIASFPALFLLFFIYGISSIHFCFMVSSLLKKPKTSSFTVFFLTVSFGVLFVMLIGRIPALLEQMLSLFCPFAMGAAILKVSLYYKYGKPFYLSNLMEEIYLYTLVFDSVLYMLLALYFDKVVPDKYGVPYHPLFFLKKSYWFKSRQRSYSSDAPTKEQSHGNIFTDNVEAVPPEFDGKEAIRLDNIKKTYKVKNMTTEALRGLSLNIYEGQITAVLGHSGAGKTTLLNILSGLSKPSDGSAMVFKYNVSEREDMEQIRRISALCPQFNIQFEFLTVKENLKIFAKIKGVPSSDVQDEVQKLLTLLDMNGIQDTQANRLSGGQKRKLSLGITFLGNPQVLFLDEPTAGLDPYSRQQVWSLLNERKAGRVILFTTQFMEEADILADRKAFISHGRLKCVGSSLFLKKKWGIGYHLRIHRNEFCDPERTTSFVKQYIPAGKLSGQRENELSYILPLENVDKFPDLFCGMDHQTELGIVNYGVTMTTLEDVFLKLEGNETFDEEDYKGALHGEPVEEEKGASSPDEMEQDLLLLSDTGRATMRGTELWRQQVCAVARMHFLNLKRESKVWGSILLISAVIVVPFVLQLIQFTLWKNSLHAELHPSLYFEPGTISFMGTSGLLILNGTGGSIDSFIHAVKSQNILVETISSYNVSGLLAHNGAIKVVLEDKKYRFTLVCHMEVKNCFPVLVNIISNALLQMLNSTAHIRVWSQVFSKLELTDLWFHFATEYVELMVVLFPVLLTHFAMNSIGYYKIKTRAQLRVSGLFPSAYWCGLALVDISLYCVLLFLVYIPWFIFLPTERSYSVVTLDFIVVLFLFGYGISNVLFLYIIAFIFQKKSYKNSFWSFTVILMTLILFIIKSVISAFDLNSLHFLMGFLIPVYTAFNMMTAQTMMLWYENTDIYDSLFWTSSFTPYIQSVAFIFLLWILEKKYGRPVMTRDPVFRISPHRKHSSPNPEVPSENEDKDVRDERERTQSALMSENQEEKPVIIVHKVHKEYKSKKVCCSCCKKAKQGKKVATRNISFCVKKGEVLGLLGPNGAGKSTTINMITGDTDVTAGKVLIKGSDAAAAEENTPAFLGYCPQENAVWPNLTVEEHLQIYAAVKGIRKDAAGAAISRIVQALELQGHVKKATKTLAAGLNRKLCFALSMMGNPAVMLLDEPTTGLDPRGKRQVWKAIHMVLKDKDQGAILTTHHMEEAEAVCDRVAIMVCGQLRCLGSIQYLKSKFGKNYLLQIKVKGVEEGDLLNTEILKLFPQAARQERISTLLVYKIPMADALPLSKAFSKLEEAKQRFKFEEYSFSLNTLEQVFLELCKEPERDYVDRTLDTTFEWKRLQQDDV